MTWPQAFFYCFLALLAFPIALYVVIFIGGMFAKWVDSGFWPFNQETPTTAAEHVEALRAEKRSHPLEPTFPSREEMATKEVELAAMQAAMCHDKRCPGRGTLKHKCHDLDCKKHPHTKGRGADESR